MKGTWESTSGGGVLSAGGVMVLVGAVVVFAERHAAGRALGEALGEAVIVAAAAAAFAVVAGSVGLVFLWRHNRRKGAELAAAFEARRAVQVAAAEASALARHQRRLELAAAQAPVINNHVWTREAIEAMRHGYAPTTVIPSSSADIEEVKR